MNIGELTGRYGEYSLRAFAETRERTELLDKEFLELFDAHSHLYFLILGCLEFENNFWAKHFA